VGVVVASLPVVPWSLLRPVAGLFSIATHQPVHFVHDEAFRIGKPLVLALSL
jgi:hypothetical protein